MARIDYDQTTAASFKEAREIPRDGLNAWRDAISRHLNPVSGMTVVDVGAGTGSFSAALCDWFQVKVIAVEPAAAMRALIPRRPDIEILAGHAGAIPVTHHIPDLRAAAREIRRVLCPGAPVLIRNAFAGRYDRLRIVRWFPEVTRLLDTYPTVEQTRHAFAAAGFTLTALEPVPQTDVADPADFLDRLDTLRSADTLMRSLTDAEYERGRQRLGEAAAAAGDHSSDIDLTTALDLLVLR
jgi:SAM-dependent methyltransferase